MRTLLSPTLLRWYIPGALRDLREQRDLTQAEVAARLGRDRSYVAQLERGRNLPARPDLEIMLDFFGVPQRKAAMVRLLDAAHEAEDWFQPFKGATPPWFDLLLAMERAADTISAYTGSIIPGLGQAPAYTDALIRHAEPDLPEDDIKSRVNLRSTRQQILHRSTPPAVHWIVDEAALRHRRFGDDIMREQLEWLRGLAELDHITLQVIPIERGPHPGVNGPFTILTLPELPLAPALAYTDHDLEGRYYDQPGDVGHYQRVFDHLRDSSLALSPADSLTLLDQTTKDL